MLPQDISRLLWGAASGLTECHINGSVHVGINDDLLLLKASGLNYCCNNCVAKGFFPWLGCAHRDVQRPAVKAFSSSCLRCWWLGYICAGCLPLQTNRHTYQYASKSITSPCARRCARCKEEHSQNKKTRPHLPAVKHEQFSLSHRFLRRVRLRATHAEPETAILASK